MANISENNPVWHDLLFDYSVFGKNFHAASAQLPLFRYAHWEKLVGTEGLFNGNLLALDIDLEMEG